MIMSCCICKNKNKSKVYFTCCSKYVCYTGKKRADEKCKNKFEKIHECINFRINNNEELEINNLK